LAIDHERKEQNQDCSNPWPRRWRAGAVGKCAVAGYRLGVRSAAIAMQAIVIA
jgi:hypothetical protein